MLVHQRVDHYPYWSVLGLKLDHGKSQVNHGSSPYENLPGPYENARKKVTHMHKVLGRLKFASVFQNWGPSRSQWEFQEPKTEVR